jgi:hypothetical protein
MKGIRLFLILIFASSYSFPQTNLKESSVTKFSNYNYVKIKDAGLKKVSTLVDHKLTLDDIASKRFDGYESKGYVGKIVKIQKWGLADLKTSQEITPIVYDHIDDEFINDVIFANSGKDYFLINKNGESTQFKNYKFIDKGSEDICCYIYDKEFRKFIDNNNKVGFFSPNWEIAIPPIYDDLGNTFNNGLVCLKLNGKLGILNSNSEFLQLPTSVSRVENFNSDGFAEYTSLNNKKGVINKKGQIIVSASYDYIDLSRINFGVSLNNKRGIVNKEGKLIIPPDYYAVHQEYNVDTKKSYYKVITLTKKEGIFDINGVQVVPPIYDAVGAMTEKISVRVNGEWRSIDDANKTSYAPTSTSQQANSQSSATATNQTTSFLDKTPIQSGSAVNNSVSKQEKCGRCSGSGKEQEWIDPYTCQNCDDWNASYRSQVACHACKNTRETQNRRFRMVVCSKCKGTGRDFEQEQRNKEFGGKDWMLSSNSVLVINGYLQVHEGYWRSREKPTFISSDETQNKMYYREAEANCLSLGPGWRLPTFDELNLLFKSQASGAYNLGLYNPKVGYKGTLPYYWTSTVTDSNPNYTRYGLASETDKYFAEKLRYSGNREDYAACKCVKSN